MTKTIILSGHGAFVDALVDDADGFERNFAGADDALFAGDLRDGEFALEDVAEQRHGMLVPAGLLARRHLDEEAR